MNVRCPFLFETLTICIATVLPAGALEPAAGGGDATDAGGDAELTLEPESLPLDPPPTPYPESLPYWAITPAARRREDASVVNECIFELEKNYNIRKASSALILMNECRTEVE